MEPRKIQDLPELKQLTENDYIELSRDGAVSLSADCKKVAKLLGDLEEGHNISIVDGVISINFDK